MTFSLRLTITWEFQSHVIYTQINRDNNGVFGQKNWKGWPDNFETFHKDIDSSSSFYQESPPWTHCVLAASSYRPCFPLTPWYWNTLSCGIETFFPWYWNIETPHGIKKIKLVDGFQIPIVHFSTVHFRPWYACSKARWAGLKRIISILLIYTGFLKVSMILNNCQEYLQSLDQAKSARKREKYANLFELSSDLSNGKFVKNISIYPSLQVTLVHPDMTREFENICKILYSERCPGEIPFKRRKKKK